MPPKLKPIRKSQKIRKVHKSAKSEASTKSIRSSVSIHASSRSGKSSKNAGRRASTKKALRGMAKIPITKIPKEKLNAALEILESGNYLPAKPKWTELCHQPSDFQDNRVGAKRNSCQRLLSECRQCLLNRDWINLSALLAMAQPTTKHDTTHYMPYFYKYGALCLIHSGDKEDLDSFLYGVVGCVTDHDKDVFLRSLTSFPEEEKKANSKRPVVGESTTDIDVPTTRQKKRKLPSKSN